MPKPLKPATSGGLVRKVLYLRPEDGERLRKAAFDEGRSESDILREALLEYLERRNPVD